MALNLHRAERTDLLADGLGALLAKPLPDPFAGELVLVPAHGVERWLSQRLSHVLGRSRASDGVCAGVAFRSPDSLIAEITGTVDDDPWSPDAMTWPLLEVIDCSLDQPWCRILARHLGHFRTGDEAESRRGRRYLVARRLAGLFASYARLVEKVGERVNSESVLERDWWRSAVRKNDGTICGEVPDLDVMTIVVVRDYDCVGVVHPTTIEVARQPDSGCLSRWLPVDNCEPKH